MKPLNKILSKEVFIQRREKLLAQIPTNSLVLQPAADLVTRSRDTEFPFRQNSDFFYLTGFTEPKAWLLMIKLPEGNQSLLFNQPKKLEEEIWTGYRLGQEAAPDALGVDAAFSLDELDQQLGQLLGKVEQVYLPFDCQVSYAKFTQGRQEARKIYKRLTQLPNKLEDLSSLLGEMRLIKQPEEIALIKEACAISAAGHLKAMESAQAGLYEYQLQAVLEAEFAYRGASFPAYTSIVGAGANACVLHYVENSSQLKDGDLVLIDAGAEYQGYAGDITRTFPVSGKFSPQQAQLYNLVLEANKLAISLTKPNASLNALHQAVVNYLITGLVKLGLLTGSLEEELQATNYQRFFMHGTSHWLGLDVHDVGSYLVNGESRPLEEGMIFTIEPGLYIQAADTSVSEEWRGIGIRIEDNVLVTATGAEVLTQAVPKEIAEIEALMAHQR